MVHNFQNCQKIVVFDGDKILLCKRKGEADYDELFSFIGGKMKISDRSIVDGLKREKDEEAGPDFRIRVYPTFSTNRLFAKRSGDIMILPHYYAEYVSGEIELNEEYSEYRWVPISELEEFEPKIETIPLVVEQLLRLKEIMLDEEFEEI